MPRGAPEKLTDEVKVKLKQAAALDATVEEMAYYCNVTKQTIYNWFERYPELFDEIERLRQKPILAARQRVAKGIDESYANAMDYLKRKKKIEFGDNTDITSGGEQIKFVINEGGTNTPVDSASESEETDTGQE